MKNQNKTRWHLVEKLTTDHYFQPSLKFEVWDFTLKMVLASYKTFFGSDCDKFSSLLSHRISYR